MASTKNLLSATTVILVVSAFTPYVTGISCFQCNSFEDKGCDVIVPINRTHSPYLKECDTRLSGSRPMFCRKIIQNIIAFEQTQTRVIRKCSYERSEKDCYHFEDDDHSEVVCQCFNDACNAGERSALPGSYWRTVLPAMIATIASSVLAMKL